MLEASGSSASAQHPSWVLHGASDFARGMEHVQGTTGSEVLAIWYRSSTWTLSWSAFGAFEPGRPHLLALLERKADGAPLWVLAAHLPHTSSHRPVGHDMAAAIARGVAETGRAADRNNLVVLGDFNEYGETKGGREYLLDAGSPSLSSLVDTSPSIGMTTCECRPPSATLATRPAAFTHAREWQPSQRPHAPVTGCTKWFYRDGATEYGRDWNHRFDHVFTSLPVSRPVELIDYAYPATRDSECETPVCIGNEPPGRQPIRNQGSWHRGLRVELELGRPSR